MRLLVAVVTALLAAGLISTAPASAKPRKVIEPNSLKVAKPLPPPDEDPVYVEIDVWIPSEIITTWLPSLVGNEHIATNDGTVLIPMIEVLPPYAGDGNSSDRSPLTESTSRVAVGLLIDPVTGKVEWSGYDADPTIQYPRGSAEWVPGGPLWRAELEDPATQPVDSATGGHSVEITETSPGKHTVEIAAKNALVISPNLNASFTITAYIENGDVKVEVDGVHDRFPSYKIKANSVVVYQDHAVDPDHAFFGNSTPVGLFPTNIKKKVHNSVRDPSGQPPSLDKLRGAFPKSLEGADHPSGNYLFDVVLNAGLTGPYTPTPDPEDDIEEIFGMPGSPEDVNIHDVCGAYLEFCLPEGSSIGDLIDKSASDPDNLIPITPGPTCPECPPLTGPTTDFGSDWYEDDDWHFEDWEPWNDELHDDPNWCLLFPLDCMEAANDDGNGNVIGTPPTTRHDARKSGQHIGWWDFYRSPADGSVCWTFTKVVSYNVTPDFLQDIPYTPGLYGYPCLGGDKPTNAGTPSA